MIKTLKIDEDGTKTNFDNSLLELFMLRSHAAEKKTFVLKISSDPYPVAFMGKANHYIVLLHKINVQALLTKIYSSPQQCCG